MLIAFQDFSFIPQQKDNAGKGSNSTKCCYPCQKTQYKTNPGQQFRNLTGISPGSRICILTIRKPAGIHRHFGGIKTFPAMKNQECTSDNPDERNAPGFT